MKISAHFDLEKTQYELDFVDIEPDKDTPLFIDPFLLGARTDSWSTNASRTLRSFFQTFINLIREGRRDTARALFNYLHEPNETCLGLSRDKPRGNAIGELDGEKLFESIVGSRAVATGIIEDLEDFRLFIPGVDKDKVSDMTTNIIRGHLVSYTQSQCRLWNIPLSPNAPSGFYWDPPTHQWATRFTEMLRIDDRTILLTPKSIVTFAKKYTPKRYFSKFVLEYLQHEHLALGSSLVQYRKNGDPYVTKKSLQEEVAPYSKEFLTSFTEAHPQVFRDFKAWVKTSATPLAGDEMSDDDAQLIGGYLIEKLRETPSGNEDATKYHRLVVGILELLFYPDVVSPIVEHEIHDGRKRIDIAFDNAANSGFFYRLHTTYQTPSQFIFVECKNYSRDVANPELDQLAGRFSVNRGRCGLLVCRSADDFDTLLQRCDDAYVDDRGLMIPLIDNDLVQMLEGVIEGRGNPFEALLTERFRQIALR